MSHRRVGHQQLTEFEWRRIIGIRKEGFSCVNKELVCDVKVAKTCEFGSSKSTRIEQLGNLRK